MSGFRRLDGSSFSGDLKAATAARNQRQAAGVADWRDTFIADLKRCQNVKTAAALVGMTVEQVVTERVINRPFAAQWAMAMADKTSRLSKLDRTVLKHIDDYICEHGNSPTQQQVALWLGQRSRGSTTTRWLGRMLSLDEVAVTDTGETLKPWQNWTRPWVLKQLSARCEQVPA